MTERLLTLLIAKAGPNLAGILARAIYGALQRATQMTTTDLDDRLLALIADALGGVLDSPDEP
jgi:hypothetical protein